MVDLIKIRSPTLGLYERDLSLSTQIKPLIFLHLPSVTGGSGYCTLCVLWVCSVHGYWKEFWSPCAEETTFPKCYHEYPVPPSVFGVLFQWQTHSCSAVCFHRCIWSRCRLNHWPGEITDPSSRGKIFHKHRACPGKVFLWAEHRGIVGSDRNTLLVKLKKRTWAESRT